MVRCIGDATGGARLRRSGAIWWRQVLVLAGRDDPPGCGPKLHRRARYRLRRALPAPASLCECAAMEQRPRREAMGAALAVGKNFHRGGAPAIGVPPTADTGSDDRHAALPFQNRPTGTRRRFGERVVVD